MLFHDGYEILDGNQEPKEKTSRFKQKRPPKDKVVPLNPADFIRIDSDGNIVGNGVTILDINDDD